MFGLWPQKKEPEKPVEPKQEYKHWFILLKINQHDYWGQWCLPVFNLPDSLSLTLLPMGNDPRTLLATAGKKTTLTFASDESKYWLYATGIAEVECMDWSGGVAPVVLTLKDVVADLKEVNEFGRPIREAQ